MVEALSYLGRDEDLIVLLQMLEQVTPLDDDKRVDLLHHFAVAHFRLNDKGQAAYPPPSRLPTLLFWFRYKVEFAVWRV